MFLRSKVQETILKGRSRSMNGGSAQQRSHVSDQLASPSSTVSRDSGNNAVSASGAGSKSATARAVFVPPRLSHSSSLPTGGSVFGKTPAPDADSSETAAFSMSPTSVLDAAVPFASGSKRRPWREGLHGLADALDGQQQQREGTVLVSTSRSSLLVRSCTLDRRVEFGVKSKGSWLPLRKAAAALSSSEPGDAEVTMEPSSEDYTCVICRGPNPRTVHIFGDRVVEDGAESELAVAACARSTRHASARRGGVPS